MKSLASSNSPKERDEYAVYPLGSENQSDILATVRVENVGPHTSEVVTTGQERTKQGHADCWIAKPLTALSRQKVSVRLAASAHKLLNHIQQTRGSDGQRWLRLCTKDEQEACMFNLAVNDSQEYEILDGTLQRIRSLPTVPIDTPDAEHHVLATLQHLAEFKYAEGIENRLPNSSLEASFSLLSSADGKGPDTSAVHDIEHGGIWRLALENHSEGQITRDRNENDNDQSGCQAADKMANDDRGDEENGDEWCRKNSHRSSYR
ncbi:hypothetical protein H633G_07447 [Metarhizium anisopliae BRIP 53284]|nr:hypothetical protein H633G_07447 [Metarhizium anisopliae BRIP 53284]